MKHQNILSTYSCPNGVIKIENDKIFGILFEKANCDLLEKVNKHINGQELLTL
jgi:hypothetical protein